MSFSREILWASMSLKFRSSASWVSRQLSHHRSRSGTSLRSSGSSREVAALGSFSPETCVTDTCYSCFTRIQVTPLEFVRLHFSAHIFNYVVFVICNLYIHMQRVMRLLNVTDFILLVDVFFYKKYLHCKA